MASTLYKKNISLISVTLTYLPNFGTIKAVYQVPDRLFKNQLGKIIRFTIYNWFSIKIKQKTADCNVEIR